MPYTPPPAPYAGLVPGTSEPAYPAPHVLVVGPTGVGKSRRVLGPGIVLWGGPAVAVSSKPDLIDLCLEPRLADGGAGHTYVLDLSGEVPDTALPAGVTRVIVDPTALITSDDDALDMATLLQQAGTAGGGGRADGGGGDPFWTTLAVGPLAAILRAAGLGPGGMAWARDAIDVVSLPKDADPDSPSWEAAIVRLKAHDSDMLAGKLLAASQLDDKMRDSVRITMQTATSPWLRSTVSGRGDETVFVPDMLAHVASTLFMVAPADGVAAGAAVAVIDMISKRWRANQTEKIKLPRVLFCVDELCNTLPWAKLPVVVTESRAMGINLLVAVQATEQFARRYGTDGMNELRSVFPSILLLTGANERQLLETAAWWDGETAQQKISTDATGKVSGSYEDKPVTRATDLLPGRGGRGSSQGRLLRGRRPGERSFEEKGIFVDLPDISKMAIA